MKSMDEVRSEFDQVALKRAGKRRKHKQKHAGRLSLLTYLPDPCIEVLEIGCGLANLPGYWRGTVNM